MSNKEVKQGTRVYHELYGKGYVVSFIHRHKDRLVWCSFPDFKTHEGILETKLRTNEFEIRLTKPKGKKNKKETLEGILGDLLRGGGQG